MDLKNAVVAKADDYSISVTFTPPQPEPEIQIHQRATLEAKIADLRARKAAEDALYDSEIAHIQALLDLCDQQGVTVKPPVVFVPPEINPDVILPDYN